MKANNEIYEWVVYDQFHWHDPDHIERVFCDKETALGYYRFIKEAFPRETFGMCKYDKYLKLKNDYRRK